MKYCTKGKHTVPLDSFADTLHTRDGKQGWCKACMRIYRTARRKPKSPGATT